MFSTPAYAQGIGDQLAPLLGGPLPMFLMIGVIFWLLVFRPQMQKQKEAKAMLASLKRGDKVVTAGGIIGVVQKVGIVANKDGKQVPSNELEVEIAPNVKVSVMRDTIATVIRPVAANDTKPTK